MDEEERKSIEDFLDDTKILKHGKPIAVVTAEKVEYLKPEKRYFIPYDPKKPKGT